MMFLVLDVSYDDAVVAVLLRTMMRGKGVVMG